MKLLIIEDEAKTSSYLQKGLGGNGFVVNISTATTACTWRKRSRTT